jgi:hypothetical protein
MVEQAGRLKDATDAEDRALMRRHLRDVDIGVENASRRRLFQSGDEIEESRLAGAVRADRLKCMPVRISL